MSSDDHKHPFGVPRGQVIWTSFGPFAWFRGMPLVLCVCVTLRQLTPELLGTDGDFENWLSEAVPSSE